jgi:hypothetical protein
MALLSIGAMKGEGLGYYHLKNKEILAHKIDL